MNNTQIELKRIINNHFNGQIPNESELPCKELLTPNEEESLAGHSIVNRIQLTKDLLNLLTTKKPFYHYFTFDKSKVYKIPCKARPCFNLSKPYELGFDYLVTYINWFIQNRLCYAALGLIIIDMKTD